MMLNDAHNVTILVFSLVEHPYMQPSDWSFLSTNGYFSAMAIYSYTIHTFELFTLFLQLSLSEFLNSSTLLFTIHYKNARFD